MMSYLLKKHANLFYISGSNYKTYRRKMSQQTLQTEYLEFSVLRIIIIVGVTSLFKEDQYLETNHRNAVKQCGSKTYLILIPMYWLSFS